jgi:urease accessory protein
MSGGHLPSLLHLCDTLFPTGGYAHSEGLEAAAAAGRATGGDDLQSWLTTCLSETIGACDGLAVMEAMAAFNEERWADLRTLDDELQALRPSSTARAASRSTGKRLLRTWSVIYPAAAPHVLAAVGPSFDVTFPVAFAIACASVGVPRVEAVEAFAYTRLAATTSSALRLLRIGQQDAHARLAAVLAQVPATAREVERRIRSGCRPGAFTPAFDLAAMSQQYVHSRLFLS